MLENFFTLYFSSSVLESYQSRLYLEKAWCYSGWRQWTRSWYQSTQSSIAPSFLTTMNSFILLSGVIDRVTKWNLESMVSQIVAGGNGKGSRNDQLSGPHGIVVDRGRNSLFIS